MAIRIPVYNAPTVQPSSAAGGGGALAQVGSLGGEAIAQGLRNVAQTVDAFSDEADRVRAQDAWNKAQPQIQDLATKMREVKGGNVLDPKAYGGAAGVPFADSVMEAHTELVRTYGADLKGRARRYYDQAAAQNALDVRNAAVNHESREVQAHISDTMRNGIVMEQETIRKNPMDLAAGARGIERIREMSARLAQSQGITDEAGKKLMETEAVSGARAGVVAAQLQAGMPAAAMAYFEAHRADFDSKTSLHLNGLIQEQLRSGRAVALVDDIFSQGLSPQEADKAIREKFKDDRAAMQEARQELAFRRNTEDVAQRQQVGRIWDMFTGLSGGRQVGLQEIRKSPDWLALDGDTRQALWNQMLDYGQQAKARAEQDPSKQDEQLVAFYDLVRNENFHNMTPADIYTAASKVGPRLFPSLMQALNDSKQPVKMKRTEVDRDILDTAAREAGFIGDKTSPADKAKLQALEGRVKLIQEASGRDWSLAETKDLVKGLLREVVVKPGRFFDDKKRFFELLEKGQVPDDFRKQANERARAAGIIGKDESLQEDALFELFLDTRRGAAQ